MKSVKLYWQHDNDTATVSDCKQLYDLCMTLSTENCHYSDYIYCLTN